MKKFQMATLQDRESLQWITIRGWSTFSKLTCRLSWFGLQKIYFTFKLLNTSHHLAIEWWFMQFNAFKHIDQTFTVSSNEERRHRKDWFVWLWNKFELTFILKHWLTEKFITTLSVLLTTFWNSRAFLKTRDSNQSKDDSYCCLFPLFQKRKTKTQLSCLG